MNFSFFRIWISAFALFSPGWITVTEWMQGPGPDHSDTKPLIAQGANNRIWIAKLNWREHPPE